MLNYWKMMVVLLVVVGFCGQSFGAEIDILLVEEPGSDGGGSGGGGSSSPSGEMRQSFDIEGFRFDVYASNKDNRTWLNAWGMIKQGVNGRYYEVDDIGTSFYTWEHDPSRFRFSGNIRLSVSDELPNADVMEMRQNSGFHAFGVDLRTDSDIRPHTDWFWDKETGEGYEILTNDIDFSFGMSLEPAIFDSLNIWVDEWEWEWTDWAGVVHYQHELNIQLNAEGHFLGENASELGSLFSAQVPEPATVLLLGLGSLLLRRRSSSG